jgi:hypothetical protein
MKMARLRLRTDAVNPLWQKVLLNYIKKSVYTSQRIQFISITKINRLTLFRKIIYIYAKNLRILINTLCGKNATFLNVKAGGNHCALKRQ